MSLVRVMPMIFCRRAEPPEPGIWPSRCSGSAYRAGLGRDAEIAGQRDFEADAKTIAAVGGDDGLGATRRRSDVPRQFGDMFGRGLQETGYIAAGGKMLARRAQHDHPHARVLIERLENKAKLIALVHFDDVQRRPVEHDVGALARSSRSRRESRRAYASADR